MGNSIETGNFFVKLLEKFPLLEIIFNVFILSLFATIIVNIITEAVKKTFFKSDQVEKDSIKTNNKIKLKNILTKISHFFICLVTSYGLIGLATVSIVEYYNLPLFLLYGFITTLFVWGLSFLFYHLFFKWLFLIGDLISLYIEKQKNILNFSILVEKFNFYGDYGDFLEKEKDEDKNGMDDGMEEKIDKVNKAITNCLYSKNEDKNEFSTNLDKTQEKEEDLLGVGTLMPILNGNKKNFIRVGEDGNKNNSLNKNQLKSFFTSFLNFVRKYKFFIIGIIITILLVIFFHPALGGIVGITTIVSGVLEKIFKTNKAFEKETKIYSMNKENYKINKENVDNQLKEVDEKIIEINQKHKKNKQEFKKNVEQNRNNEDTTGDDIGSLINKMTNILNNSPYMRR